MNKKYQIIIILILVATAGVFGWMFWKNKIQKDEKKTQAEKVSQLLPEASCNFKNDGEANAKAIESKDAVFCSCVKDEKRKESCQRGVMDVNLYQQAVGQYDEHICASISETSIREACVSVTKNGTESLRRSNPSKLAFIYGQSGNYDRAIDLYLEILKKNPRDLDNLLAVAVAYANKGVALHEEKAFGQKAFEAIEKARALDANNPEVYRVEGFVYETLGDFNASLQSYNKALGIDPVSIQAFVGRGHAHNMMGILEKALEDFKKAAELDVNKENLNIYAQLCRLEATRSDLFEEAVKNCNFVVDSPLDSPVLKSESLQILGDLYIKLKRLEEAEAKLKLALVYSPNEANAYLALAKLGMARENFPMAQEMAEKALRLDGKKVMAYGSLAYSLYRQGKNQEAEKVAIQGMNNLDQDPSLLVSGKMAEKKNLAYVLANIYNALGNKEKESEYKKMGDEIKI
ncbi:MAG: tetratricopeptide repeat protein [Patescibacteria group bacterium]